MRTIHFIGICGTAMATLAAMLRRKGFNVQGSDHGIYPPMSEFLAREGIAALAGYRPEHITGDIDLVIVGNAISRGNAELEEVLDRRIRYCSLPEAVRDHFLWGSRSIVVTGTHGKTTTTALTGWLLTSGGIDPSMFAGGIAANFESSCRLGSGRDFVIEGDEYDSAFFDKTAKFLKYLPEIAIVGNIEFDHVDIYEDMAAIRRAFGRFIGLVPRRGLIILGADSPEAMALRPLARCRVETVGLSEGADWLAEDITVGLGGTSFHVRHNGESFGRFDMPLLGAHNVRNALAATAVGCAAGLDADALGEGLRSFRGVRRRLESRGEAGGVSIYDDFAHHPTAVAETLSALRLAHGDTRIWAIFEPRSATSCRRVFQKDFARSFGAADEVVVAAVYRSSLPDDERLSPEELVADLRALGQRARHIPRVDDIVTAVAEERREGDLVVVMSNGGFDGIHEKLLKALRQREAGI